MQNIFKHNGEVYKFKLLVSTFSFKSTVLTYIWIEMFCSLDTTAFFSSALSVGNVSPEFRVEAHTNGRCELSTSEDGRGLNTGKLTEPVSS